MLPRPPAVPLSAAASNPLQRLITLRWIEIVALTVALLLGGAYFGMALPFAALWGVVTAMVLINLATLGRLASGGEPASREMLLHLSLDLLSLTALLYFTGGSVNPFVSLLLLPLTIGATMLALVDVGLLTVLALACYSLLMFYSVPLPSPEGGPLAEIDRALLALTGIAHGHEAHFSGHGFGLHIVGMWLNFMLSALLISLFVSRMAHALRHRDAALAEAREQALRNEQILAIGTLAAGAAHQLGTPLTTLTVVLHELRLAYAGNGELNADLALMEHQVKNCKEILSRILSAAGQDRHDGGALIDLHVLVNDSLEQWRLIRPAAHCTLAGALLADPQLPAPQVFADRTLEQALLNLLDNAADASPSGIEVRYGWDAASGILEILDDGPGIDAAIAGHIGKAFVRSRKGGLGIGLFLSNATIERFGGKVELLGRPEGGTCTRITLPGIAAPGRRTAP